MKSVKSARSRLWEIYPKVLMTCGNEGLAYAKCVTESMSEVRKGQCNAEFLRFKKCLQESAKKSGGKL